MFTYIPKFNDLSEVEYKDYRNEEEREFLMKLWNHVAEWEQYGFKDDDFIMFYDGSVLTIAFDICDVTASQVLRSLRIDFTKTSLLLGKDETMQYVSRLNVNNPDVKVYRKTEYTTVQLAEIAAQWIAYELSRKIELHQWINEAFHHRCWVLADMNQTISVSDSKGVFRRNEVLGRPTKVTIVYPKEILNNQ